MESVNLDEKHVIKRMPDPLQFIGEWNWCHDGDNKTDYLKLNDKRVGESGGSRSTYWYIMPDYKIYIGRTSVND